MSFKELGALLGQAATSSQQAQERPKVVVVDDDLAMRRSLETLLGETYRVATAASAQKGVEAVDEDTCAVVLDIKMKGHDGFWACAEIRKRFPEVPVIFYTAYQDLKDPYAIINEHRPFGYLTKDGDFARLQKTLDTAVRLHRVTLYNKKLVGSLRGRKSER